MSQATLLIIHSVSLCLLTLCVVMLAAEPLLHSCLRHSLGGALATLAAFDIASAHADLPVTCYTFGGPRHGFQLHPPVDCTMPLPHDCLMTMCLSVCVTAHLNHAGRETTTLPSCTSSECRTPSTSSTVRLDCVSCVSTFHEFSDMCTAQVVSTLQGRMW